MAVTASRPERSNRGRTAPALEPVLPALNAGTGHHREEVGGYKIHRRDSDR